MMKALFTEKDDRNIICKLCPHECRLTDGQTGMCLARKNIDDQLISLTYNHPVSINIDPIEKKPLYHYYPGHQILSIGTAGCNFKCQNCQNHDISMSGPVKSGQTATPEEIINIAKQRGVKLIAYTYNEPTVFYEYMFDIAKIARKNNIKNVIVSNGYINLKPLAKLAPLIDAANIDLKAFDDHFYKKVCQGSLEPVLSTLKYLKKHVHLEITNLMISGKNDDINRFSRMSRWIREELSKDTPLHISRFFPHYKMSDVQPTEIITLEKAHFEAKKHLNYVYIGNIQHREGKSTHCPHCDELLIDREGYTVDCKISTNKCPKCQTVVYGKFDK
ncbi:AmmeMemoRadiSam system radical SAM enzyme [Candidatus Woesearchaeota archaeon]|nr:AmmeMemoRadiSam system radical SAM enzyme [Candidatus Woesearchaeota archaeon]